MEDGYGVAIAHNHETQAVRPRIELADIFNRYFDTYKLERKVSIWQEKVVSAIRVCRTSALGGHTSTCNQCGHKESSYNSCRDRHCPKCLLYKTFQWVSKRLDELLPIPYFHCVFTMPHLLNALALCNKEVIYDLFFKAAAYTLNAFARDPKFLGAKIGAIGILHTWGQSLSYHVHLHFIVTGGGISLDGAGFIRLPYQEKFLFPIHAMPLTMRAKFEKLLMKAYENGELRFPGELQKISDPVAFKHFTKRVCNEAWIVDSRPPFAGPEQVIRYIGRYTHRVAISNKRLIAIEDGKVTFRYKAYKERKQEKYKAEIKPMALPVETFIRRYLWHIVPKGFKRIRHIGFLAAGNRRESLDTARLLLAAKMEETLEKYVKRQKEYEENRDKCPKCKTGLMVITEIIAPVKTAADLDSS